MISAQFIAIWFAWLLAGGSPGPATLGIAGTAMSEGRRPAVIFALGILAGSATWGIAAALGLSAIMLTNAWVFEIIRYAGAAYLGWLALKALRRALTPGAAVIGTPFSGSARTLFAKGAAIHITNPKAVLGWGSIYAIIAPPEPTPGVLFGYFLALYTGSIFVFLGYAILFSSERVVRSYAKARRWFDGVFAAFFGVASFQILTARLQ